MGTDDQRKWARTGMSKATSSTGQSQQGNITEEELLGQLCSDTLMCQEELWS